LLKEHFKELYGSLSDGCKNVFETIDVSIEPSQSLSLIDGMISFNRTLPILLDEIITYTFKLMDFKLKVPLRAIVCGFEKIEPKSGFSILEFELSKEDQSQQYFPDLKFNQLLKTSHRECYIDETTFKLVQTLELGPLTNLKGKNYVMIDQSK
jgi:hypothetical protein